MPFTGNLGFIGVGKIGSALVEGVLRAGVVEAGKVLVSDTDESALNACCQRLGVRSLDSFELVKKSQAVVLCVKPQIVPAVLYEIVPALARDTLVISVAAGITTGLIESGLAPEIPVVRAMPNIAATVGASATAIAPGKSARAGHLQTARLILESVGLVVELPEKLIDAVTGLSGSGPAYVFMFAEALINGALKVGIPHDQARLLAVQTLKGAVAMLEADPKTHPAALRDLVTTPGGTTIAAVHELERKGFRDAVASAVEAAARRAAELGGEEKKR